MSCLKLKLEIYEIIFFSIVLAFKILLYVVFTGWYHVRVKSKQTNKKIPDGIICYFTMLFIRSFLYNSICWNIAWLTSCTTQKCFKYDDSNKKKLYKMFVNIMCNMQPCDNIFSENFRTNDENYLKMCLSIICCIFSTNCHAIRGGRLTGCPRW